jgi:hypothetical protein
LLILGLEINLNIGQADFMTAAGSVAGVIVLMHGRNEMPFPEDYGIMLTPGVFNVISLRLMQIQRMPAPFGDCIADDIDTTDINVYAEHFNAAYSKEVRHSYTFFGIVSFNVVSLKYSEMSVRLHVDE